MLELFGLQDVHHIYLGTISVTHQPHQITKREATPHQNVSQRRRERRHYLKQLKKRVPASEFKAIKESFKAEGKKLRLEDLRESLEEEKEKLAHQEGEMRKSLKEQGFKKKEIDQKIEEWMANTNIWSLHSDVYDDLI